MKKLLLPLTLLFAIILTSCSKEDSYFDTDSSEQLISTGLTSRLDKFDFGNMKIEESWTTEWDGSKYPTRSYDIDITTDPDEPYFYENSANSVLNLKCKKEKGRRSEVKEDTGDEGPLTEYRKIDFLAYYFNIPNKGVTIAQVHNRGSNGGKPLFRLELEADGSLKTIIRDLPNGDSDTDTNTIPNFKYEGGSLRVILKKESGDIVLKIRYKGDWVINTTFQAPDAWDISGVRDDYYLKAGVYTEGDDKETRVKYSKFIISY